jgi:hypothetical protein
MNKLFAVASVFAAFIAPNLAEAAPFISLQQTAPSTVIQVAGGCGPGWHRGPYGGCRRNWANPAAHACPRGYHIGPGGRCRGNGR